MSKWISVNERLPDCDGSYIVATSRGAVCTTHWWTKAHRWSGRLGVTHWMPLPEPPGEMTVFDQLTESPEALAKLILRMHPRDISLEWCKGDKAEACVKAMDNGDFVCTDERLTECIISWLQSPAEEG